MKRLCIAAILTLVCVANAQAQLTETAKVKNALSVENKDTVCWKRNGVFQVGLNQGFLHNASSGGEVVSLAVDGLLNGSITRLYHNQVWDNSIIASYSLFYAYSNHFVPRKVDDQINLTSKYGRRLDTTNFYFAGIFNFKSQFTKGYDYTIENWQNNPTSNFLSPGYFTLGAGMEYRRGDRLSLFFSPIAARLVVASQKYTISKPEGAFGVPYGKTSKFEFGAYFSGNFQYDITPGIRYKTRLDLYSNYLAKDRTDSLGTTHDNPGNIDILWDNLLSFKLGKYFNLNIALTAIYDNDQPYDTQYKDATSGLLLNKDEPGTGLGWWQIKEVMSFGFAYHFH